MKYTARGNFFAQAMRAEELQRFIMEEFVDVMRQRGHEIEFIGDEILLETV